MKYCVAKVLFDFKEEIKIKQVKISKINCIQFEIHFCPCSNSIGHFRFQSFMTLLFTFKSNDSYLQTFL